jgi:6-phosphofructokinase
MNERIGVVTGGGDCLGLNAVIHAVAKAAAKRGWETIGFFDRVMVLEGICLGG